MLHIAKRLESICAGIESARLSGNKVAQCHGVYALLRVIVGEHELVKACAKRVVEIRKTVASRVLLDDTTVCEQYYHGRSSGWGHRGNSYTVGRSGNNVQPVDDSLNIIAMTIQLRTAEELVEKVNSMLIVLQQYADQFNTYRKEILGTVQSSRETPSDWKPVNVGMRAFQNWLFVTVPNNRHEERGPAPILGHISGLLTESSCKGLHNVGRIVVKPLNSVKGNVGRLSEKAAGEIHKRCEREVVYKNQEYVRQTYNKHVRCLHVQNYVANSSLYRAKLGWIVGLKNIEHTLPIMPHIDNLKRQYIVTDKLARITAINRKPYVPTIVCSPPVNVGTIRHLETDIPLYRCTALLVDSNNWQTIADNGLEPNHLVWFLGKTGSVVVDRAISGVDWFHSNPMTYESLMNEMQHNRVGGTVPGIMLQRLTGTWRSTVNQDNLKQRRLEIATYARKLVWLNTINMLDSKAAGNCLPGTIQFARELGLPISKDWEDKKYDTRLLLRRWKEKSYGVNRLLLPAIDAACNRVKAKLLSLTTCYVPTPK